MPIGDDILSLCHLEACERQRLALLDLLEHSIRGGRSISRPSIVLRLGSYSKRGAASAFIRR